jgi:hypothetical protein
MKGQPTSIHASLTVTTTHRDLMKELKGGSKSDAIEVETNEEVMPDAS